jgi:hypothetical protein
MVTEKDRMVEWLKRVSNQVEEISNKQDLSNSEKLDFIRQSYSIINVLTIVARNEAYMLGISPINLN